MKCPVCDVPLSISSREGIEIDFCPQCRGVWLDRGELDKIIERTADAYAPSGGGAGRPAYDDRGYDSDDRRRNEDRRYDDRRRYDDDDDRRRQGHGKRKKRGFLGDLFEFGGEGDD
jgi:uncharacterized protein